MEEKQLLIGKVARQIGVNPKTIRYYEGINLLPKPKRERNNYRVYSQDAIKRVNFIKKAQSLGSILEEITLRDSGFKPCAQVRGLLKQRIIDLDQKLTELITLRQELKKL
jgi:DNA-binding transcriptional MerR regulator